MTDYYKELNKYYISKKIHPLSFDCPNQLVCRSNAHLRNMTEAKMSMVGSHYGVRYPTVVVISLDPPKEDKFLDPNHRITEYLSKIHEKDTYSFVHPNPHWAMTQIIVKDILCLWGYKPLLTSAVVGDSYKDRPIENVSAYFSHVNMSKCSMNNLGQGRAPRKVHELCSSLFLMGELNILKPDILISQGSDTNQILGGLWVGHPVLDKDLPTEKMIGLWNKNTLWLPMHHPSYHFHTIRAIWPIYEGYLKNYRVNNRIMEREK
jgi:hypothetical protein